MMTTKQIQNCPQLYRELSMLAFKRFLAYLRRLRKLQIKMIKHGRIRVRSRSYWSLINETRTYPKGSVAYRVCFNKAVERFCNF